MLRFARSLRSLRRRLSPPRRSSLEEPRARGPRCAASVAGRTAAGPRSAWAPCAFASGAPSPGRGMPGRRPRPVRAVPRANSHASAATAPMAASTFSTRGRPRPSVTKIACSRGRGASLWLSGGDEGAEVVTAEIGVRSIGVSEVINPARRGVLSDGRCDYNASDPKKLGHTPTGLEFVSKGGREDGLTDTDASWGRCSAVSIRNGAAVRPQSPLSAKSPDLPSSTSRTSGALEGPVGTMALAEPTSLSSALDPLGRSRLRNASRPRPSRTRS